MSNQGQTTGREVFLSYASQDAEAVQRIAEALRAAGVEVWFDQNELVGGDAWDQKIRRQIKECALFMPVISAATQARTEGYFRLEWRLADQRTHLMAKGRPFLLPVVIDGTRDAEAHVPDSFTEVQWTRLPGGETTPAFCARVKKLLGGEGVAAGSEVGARLARAQEGGRGPATPLHKPARAWLVPVIIGAAAVVGLVLWQPWRGKEMPTSPASPVALAAPAAPISEARKLVAQARVLFDDGDDANHENFFLADDLLKKALALDSTDGEVWAAQTELSADMVMSSYDRSASRLQILRTQAERSVKLAPASAEAQLAYANYLVAASFLTANGERFATEALEMVRKFKPTPAQQSRTWRTELLSMVVLGKFDDWLATIAREDAPQLRDARLLDRASGQFFFAGRYAEAEEFNVRSLALRKTGRAQMMNVSLKLTWRGDLDGAAAALAEWPTWLSLEDRGAFQASQVWLWRHEPEKAIAVLTPVSRDFLNDSPFVGPKAALVALAQEMAGNPQAARAAWEETKRVATRVATEQTADQRALVWRAVAMARLGEMAEAETLFRQLEQTKTLRSEFWSCAAPSALLRIALGKGDEVVAKFDRELRSNSVRQLAPSPQAALRLNPIFDPIRATPEFQQWMASAPAPEKKKENKPTTAVAPAVNEKSLVVLPLENLSPDPENAFFTDGMHAEIIATLQRALPDLTVISRNSALAFKDSKMSLAEIAQRLGIANVIVGSVRRAGGRVRIQLELRRASDEATLWVSPKAERELKDVFAIQSEVAEEVARVLQIRGSKGSFGGARFTTKEPRAFDLFLKARALMGADYDPRDSANRLVNLEAGIRLAEEAMKLDAGFATAAGLLANLHELATNTGSGNPESRHAHALDCKRWADEAARLMPGGAGEYGLAVYYANVERDYARALRFAQNTLRALPNDADAHNFVAICFGGLGRIEEALSAYRRAIDLDPLVKIYWQNALGTAARLRRQEEFASLFGRSGASKPMQNSRVLYGRYMLTGELRSANDPQEPAERVTWLWRGRKFGEALTVVETELARSDLADLTRFSFLGSRSDLLRRLGRDVEATDTGREMLVMAQKLQSMVETGPSQKLGYSAAALVRAGRMDEAIATARLFVEAASPAERAAIRWTREVTLAEAYAHFNRSTECIELLAKLLRAPSGLTVPMLKVDPVWDNVREDAAFKALLADPKNSAPL